MGCINNFGRKKIIYSGVAFMRVRVKRELLIKWMEPHTSHTPARFSSPQMVVVSADSINTISLLGWRRTLRGISIGR